MRLGYLLVWIFLIERKVGEGGKGRGGGEGKKHMFLVQVPRVFIQCRSEVGGEGSGRVREEIERIALNAYVAAYAPYMFM